MASTVVQVQPLGGGTPVFAVEVEARRAGREDRLTVYNLDLSSEGGTWHEEFASREALAAFLTGVRATSGMIGLHMPEVDIPQP